MTSIKTKVSGMKKISSTKVSNIIKLKSLGYTVKEIARLTGVSMITVNDYTLPGFYDKRLKRSRDYFRGTVAVTGATEEGAVVIEHLHKRPRPETCEMCGEGQGKRLYYHHWDDDDPSLGIWVGFKCHRLVELVDSKGIYGVVSLVKQYESLKAKVLQEQQ